MVRKKKDLAVSEEESLLLNEHLKALGFKTTEWYQTWCEENGFGRKLVKEASQRRKELTFRAEQVALEQLKARKAKFEPSSFVLEAMRANRVQSGQARSSDSLSASSRGKAQLDLHVHLQRVRAKFLGRREGWPGLGAQVGNSFSAALDLLGRHSVRWVRKVEDWKPRSHNPLRQFQSLIRHLLADYDDIPSFFDRVWFLGETPEAQRQQRWYLQVASGNNIRHCDTPIELTKKMAHHFMRAPSHVTVEQAIRWGQVHGLGGDARLATALLPTRLCENFANDEFWSSVIAWFIANPMLDMAHVGPIIDYLHDQRFGSNRWVMVDGRRVLVEAAQPNLTMKGRTADSLLRQVEAWHRQLRASNLVQNAQWTTSGVPEFEFWEGPEHSDKRKRWTIRELMSAQSLMIEGKQLKHCVYSYARSCAAGHCSIWTLELESREGLSKLVTLEVRNATRTIVQARGKLNRVMTAQERAIVQRWASRARLNLASYV